MSKDKALTKYSPAFFYRARHSSGTTSSVGRSLCVCLSEKGS